MTNEQAEKRITKLRALIDDYRYHYHVLDESTMSEAAADSLKHELSQLEEQYPDLITPDSPTQRVAGRALDKFTKVPHKKRMISLADTFSEAEIRDWLARLAKLGVDSPDLFADIKMDGLACALIYEDGLFVQAITRGDGTVGEDVTSNVRTISNIPLSIPDKTHTEVRGEIVIFKKDFATLNAQRQAQGEPAFANPRNLAAGTIRQLDPSVAASRPLRFIAYDLVAPDQPTFSATYDCLTRLGFQTSGQHKLFRVFSDLTDYIAFQDTHRETLSFGTDGIVIKLDDRRAYDRLGTVGKTPRAAVAYKFPAEQATTIVRDIVISLGRTGAATPVAVLDPVQLAGSTVRHASLHNADEIARLGVRIGDTVIVYKAGDIIPQIERVLAELRPAGTAPFSYEQALADQYPELEFERTGADIVYRVKGTTSDQILKRAIEYYASKSALDIAGLGPKNVTALVDAGLVKSIADLYRLAPRTLTQLDRFADTSAANLIAAIASKKTPPLAKFITALGIRHVGGQTATELAAHFQSFAKLSEATEDELLAIDGIGVVVAESIIAWFADPDNQSLITDLTALGVEPHYAAAATTLAGKSYVITGTLQSMPREQAEQKLRDLGATITGSITKTTTALIAGANPGAGKTTKAAALGTPTLSESDLLALLGMV